MTPPDFERSAALSRDEIEPQSAEIPIGQEGRRVPISQRLPAARLPPDDIEPQSTEIPAAQESCRVPIRRTEPSPRSAATLLPQQGESGIVERLSAFAKRDDSPIERGYRYLRRIFDVDHCYQSVLSRTPDFNVRMEMPDEVFTSAIILDALQGTTLLSHRVKARIVDFLAASHEDGLFSYFVEKDLLPRDVDDTGLALSALIHAGAVRWDVARRAASKVLENVDDTGVIHVYLPPRGEREDRPRVDPIPCASALYLAYQVGREADARPTEEYLVEAVRQECSGASKGFYYYLTPDVLIYWASRLLRFDRFRDRHRGLLEDALRARIGSNDDVLDLALRSVTADALSIDNRSDKAALAAAQRADGSWPIVPIYKLGRSNVYVGSEALVTAFALKAMDDE